MAETDSRSAGKNPASNRVPHPVADERDVLVLDPLDRPEPDEVATIEHEPRPWLLWTLIAVVALVALVSAVGALIDGGGDDAEPVAEPDAAEPDPAEAASDEAPADPAEEQDAAGGDDPDAPVIPQVGQGPAGGQALPASIPPPGLPDGTMLVGHAASGRVAAVFADGTVEEFLVGDGVRFLPQAATDTSVLGLLTFTGATVALGADGLPGVVATDNRDAPIYLRDSADGYIMYGTWLGQVDYLAASGATTGSGPSLAVGTHIIGDTRDGIAVETLDGRAVVVDRVTGETVHRLDTVPLFAAGAHYVATVCGAAADCRVVARSLDGDEVTLAADPARADRVVIGMSPGGTRVLIRQVGGVGVIDTRTGEVLAVNEDIVARDAEWYGETHAVMWSDRGAVVLVDTEAGTVTPVDLGGTIAPQIRRMAFITG